MSTIAPVLLQPQPIPASGVQVKLENPLPANINGPIMVQVVNSQPNGKATLQLPNGQQIQATLSPPLTPGTQLNVSPPPTSTALQLAAQLPKLPTSNASSTVSSSSPQQADTGKILTTTTTPLPPQGQSTTPVTVLRPTPLLQAFTPPPSPLPTGPVNVTIPQTTSLQTIPTNTPLTATVTAPPTSPTPTTPVSSQPAQISLPTTPQPVPASIQTGQFLPTGTTVTLTFSQPPIANQATTATVLNATFPSSPSTGTSAISPPPTSTPTPAPTPPSLLKIQLPPLPPNIQQFQQPTTLTARVLAPPPSGLPAPTPQNPTPASQPILLANGQQTVVQSPHGVPTGSVLVIDINPLSGTAAVARVESPSPHGQQPQSQTATTNIQPQTPQAVLALGNVLTGTVIQQNPAQQQVTIQLNLPTPAPGQPLPAQPPQLTLQTPQPIPLGATLTVKIQPDGQAQLLTVTLPSGYGQSHAITTLSRQWDALTNALHTLAANNPALVASAKGSLPHTANLMTLLPYIDATRSNVPERVIGREATQILRAMGVDLAPDLSQLQLLSQPQPNDPQAWRGVLFPYIENPTDDPRQGGFFWRRQKKNEDDHTPSSTRFVVELNLSQMGDVQLDGLLSYPDLWLKLRRHTPSEPGFVEGLQTLVKTTLESLHLAGGISIETTPTFDVNPQHDILTHAQQATLATDA